MRPLQRYFSFLCAAQTIESILKAYQHDVPTYVKVGEILNGEMVKGLSKTENKNSTVKMLITYVRNLPTGKGTLLTAAF